MSDPVGRPEFEHVQKDVGEIFGYIKGIRDDIFEQGKCIVRLEGGQDQIAKSIAAIEGQLKGVGNQVTRWQTVWSTTKTIVTLATTSVIIAYSAIRLYQAMSST